MFPFVNDPLVLLQGCIWRHRNWVLSVHSGFSIAEDAGDWVWFLLEEAYWVTNQKSHSTWELFPTTSYIWLHSRSPEDWVCKDAMFRKLPWGRMACKGARSIQDLSVLLLCTLCQMQTATMLLCCTDKGRHRLSCQFWFPCRTLAYATWGHCCPGNRNQMAPLSLFPFCF